MCIYLTAVNYFFLMELRYSSGEKHSSVHVSKNVGTELELTSARNRRCLWMEYHSVKNAPHMTVKIRYAGETQINEIMGSDVFLSEYKPM